MPVADFRIVDGRGPDLGVREIRGATGAARGALILVHGGGPGGVASFDLPVPGHSLARDFANSFNVYVMDVRGWGSSARPPAMDEPAECNPPAVCSEDAVADIDRVVTWLQANRDCQIVSLFGWATGGHWAAMYTSRHNDRINGLVILNSLYSVDADWGMRTAFEAPDRPGEFDRHVGAYGLRTAASLLGAWDRTIPVADKTRWRDPAVAVAYTQAALASDPTSQTRQPPSLRIPSCFQRESYEMSRGRTFWQARDIRVPVLLVCGELDFWSRPIDDMVMAEELINSPRVERVTIPNATHYLFNDRPEHGRRQLNDAVTSFLGS